MSLLAVWLWLAMGGSASAARLLNATVELNGQIVLRSTYSDGGLWGDDPGAATVWRYLGRAPMWTEKSAPIQADTSDPLQAKLRGILVIRFKQVNRLVVEAKAVELTLIRATPSSDGWFLPVDEVERIASVNGIPAVVSPIFVHPGTWLGLCIAAVVCAWLLTRKQRHRSREKPT